MTLQTAASGRAEPNDKLSTGIHVPSVLISTLFAESRPRPAAEINSCQTLNPVSEVWTSRAIEFEKTLSQIALEQKESASSLHIDQCRRLARTPEVLQIVVDTFPSSLSTSDLRRHPLIVQYEEKHGVEIIFDQLTPTLSSNAGPVPRRPLALALFDMDSTLINEEVIDELARSIGVSDAVSAITARAMNGEIDFATSLQERVAMLQGVNVDTWETMKKTVSIAEGARELIAGLRRRGVITGVISGGFTPMAEWLKGELGLDYAFANHVCYISIYIEYIHTDNFPSSSSEFVVSTRS